MEKLKNNENYGRETFEEIKHIDESGMEYWYARELQLVLDYKEWRKFEGVIKGQKKLVKTVVLMHLNILSEPTSCQNVLIMQKW